MKKAIAILLAGCMLMSASGCNQDIGIIGGADGPTAIIVGSIEGEKKQPARVEHEYTNNNDEFCTYYMTLNAYDENGALMWKYITPDSMIGQCESLECLGMKNGLVYVNESGLFDKEKMSDGIFDYSQRLRALSTVDGTVVWDNTDYSGTGSSYVFDDEGNIYLTGYFGPDCMKIDCTGKTVWMHNSIDPDLYWAYDITLENDVITVHYEMNANGESDTVRLSVDGEVLD